MTQINLNIDEGFQLRQRRRDRTGWVLMALLLVVALAGGIGPGLLGRVSAESDQGTFTLEYDRVEHQQADGSVTLSVQTADTESFSVELTGQWVESADLRGVTPEPEQQLVKPRGITLVFAVASPGEQQISLAYRMQRIGPLDGRVSMGDQSVSFRQFILP